ncbi:MAG: hypothetical protein D6763_03120 [Alphaproteobacteria bacterium]|nr:MAG: hypothetical protein D6763_03120 [Alphaproteobacteria bacterium]
MEEANLIFDIIRNYHLERLESHLRRNGPAALLARDEERRRPIEVAMRHLIGTRNAQRRMRLVAIIRLLFDTARDNGLEAAATRCHDESSAIDAVFQLARVEDTLVLLAIFLGLDEDQTELLLQFPDNPTESVAKEIRDLLAPKHYARLFIYLLRRTRRKAVETLFPLIDLAELAALDLSDDDKEKCIGFAVSMDNPTLIELIGAHLPTFPGGKDLLVSALKNNHEDVAIALVRIGISPSPFRQLRGFMPVREERVDPVQIALTRKLYGFIAECIRLGLIKNRQLIDCCTRNLAVFEIIRDEPDLLPTLQLDWRSTLAFLPFASEHRPVVVLLWPAITRALSRADEDALFCNYLIGEMSSHQDPARLLLTASTCLEMRPQNYHTLVKQVILYSYSHCNPECLRALCAIGTSPQFALNWCLEQSTAIDPDTGKAQFGEPFVTLCRAAFQGTIQFLADVRTLAPVPLIQGLCLDALGDLPSLIGDLETVVQLTDLPDPLRQQVQVIYDEIIAFWTEDRSDTVPRLQDLSIVELFAALGLNTCTYETLNKLLGETPLSSLPGRLLQLIVVMAMEYKQRGEWPNPLAAFALAALLDRGDEFAWFTEIYEGTAEIERENPED